MDRDGVLNDFRQGRSNILVATDVAARGLDVDGIKYVINFDFPQSSEDYIHRIGRTGRKHSTGTSYAFFTRKNAKCAKALLDILREANQNINPDLEYMARNASSIMSKEKSNNRAMNSGFNRRDGGGGAGGGGGNRNGFSSNGFNNRGGGGGGGGGGQRFGNGGGNFGNNRGGGGRNFSNSRN